MGPSLSVQAAFAADHDRLDELFSRYCFRKHSDFRSAREFFKGFNLGLRRHIVWEEDILFPRFEQKTGMFHSGPTEVMRAEHRQIKEILEAIHHKVEEQDPDTDAEERQLLEVLSAHNQKEETFLYPALDRFLSDAEKAEVFTEMEKLPAEACGACCGRH